MKRRQARDAEALVLGAGMAGLLAARVLADHFGQVSLIEQDDVTATTEHHKGTPQAHHPHVLFARGAEILERLFPGLRSELTARGAPVIDVGADGAQLLPTGWAPKGALGVSVQMVTRSALEAHIRRRVLALPEVSVTRCRRVENLIWDESHNRVIGMQTAPARGSAHQKAKVSVQLSASLVVCATGRTSALPDWLRQAGYPAPRSRSVAGSIAYSSCLIQPAPSGSGRLRADAQLTFAPRVRRGGMAVTVEDGRQLVSLLGADGELPPKDPAKFLAYAQSLGHPGIAEAFAHAESRGPIHRMLNLNNQWTLYHRMPRWPEQLVVLGDAFCVFNPIYGQGMTVAAIEAEVLDVILSRQPADNLTGLSRDFQRQAARVIRVPWAMATNADLRWVPGQQTLTARAIAWYTDRLLHAIPRHLEVYRRFYQVAQLASSPLTLLHPTVLRAMARARRSSRPDPPASPEDHP